MFARPHQRVTTMMMALALLTGVAACGDDDDEDNDAATSAEDTAAVTTESPATTARPTTAAPVTTAADTTAAPSTTGPATTEPTTTLPPEPCEPIGVLVPGDFGMNDRCEEPQEGWGQALVDEELAWGHTGPCADLLAVPNQLLVVIGTPFESTLDVALNNVAAELAFLGVGVVNTEAITDQFGIVELNADLAQVQSALPSLQRAGRSVDLNYLEPVQPNNGFRPWDDPKEPSNVEKLDENQLIQFGGADGKSVAVIDSPEESASLVYDVDGNGLIDEDHGHGVFVRSIVERSEAAVTLVPVPPDNPGAGNPSVLPSTRWSPMMFSDAQIVLALESVDAGTDVVNMSLGGVGCPLDELGGGRLAVARAMNNLLELNGTLKFVAAAGNNGEDVLHFPAAWANPDVVALLTGEIPNSSLIDQLDPSDPDRMLFGSDEVGAAIAELESLQENLMSVLYAVGSVEGDGTRSVYSNCGNWVNAVAFGTNRLGVYPYPDSQNAAWSGTSFAAANFTAALVAGAFDNPPSAAATDALAATGAQMRPSGFPC